MCRWRLRHPRPSCGCSTGCGIGAARRSSWTACRSPGSRSITWRRRWNAPPRALGGAGALQCWGLPEGQRRRLPCRFLDTILPYQPDGTPAAAWTTAIHATARLQAVAACPAYNPAAVAEAVDRWTQGVDPATAGIANAWQRWQEDHTAARLLGEWAWPVDAAATTLPGGPLVVEGRDPGVHDDRDPGVTDDRNDAEQSVASDDDECVDDDGAVDRACARRARTCPGPRARSEGGGGGVASAPRDQPSARAVPSGSDHRGGGWSPLRRAQTYYVT